MWSPKASGPSLQLSLKTGFPCTALHVLLNTLYIGYPSNEIKVFAAYTICGRFMSQSIPRAFLTRFLSSHLIYMYTVGKKGTWN